MNISPTPENFSDVKLSNRPAAPVQSIAINEKVLAALANQLPDSKTAQESSLRLELIEVESHLWQNRCDKGRILSGYRDLYKPIGHWYSFLKAVGLNERSAFNIIADYIATKELPDALRDAAHKLKIDIASKKQRPLLAKLVDLGFDDALTPEELIHRAQEEVKAARTKESVTPDQRFERAYISMKRMFENVDGEIRNAELDKLFSKLKAYFRRSDQPIALKSSSPKATAMAKPVAKGKTESVRTQEYEMLWEIESTGVA